MLLCHLWKMQKSYIKEKTIHSSTTQRQLLLIFGYVFLQNLFLSIHFIISYVFLKVKSFYPGDLINFSSYFLFYGLLLFSYFLVFKFCFIHTHTHICDIQTLFRTEIYFGSKSITNYNLKRAEKYL